MHFRNVRGATSGRKWIDAFQDLGEPHLDGRGSMHFRNFRGHISTEVDRCSAVRIERALHFNYGGDYEEGNSGGDLLDDVGSMLYRQN